MRRLLFFLLILVILIYGCEQKYQEQQNIIQKPIIEQKIESTLEPECRISEDCNSNQYCSNSKCLSVNCPNGEIVNHVCKEYQCLFDNDCRNEEICSNRQCEKLNCKINLVPQDHK